jgi:thiol-disulfide isomerase/thioredoxin
MTQDTQEPNTSNRRRWLSTGVAAVAGATGLLAGWWQMQAAAQAKAAEVDIWQLKFDTPSGSKLAMAQFKGKPLLLNFWATWCPPCIEELPLIDAFYKENAPKGWQVVGLAVDQAASVKKFLSQKPLGFSIGITGLQGTELSKSLGNLTGGLPFSVVYGANGEVAQRKIGKLSEADLARWSTLT